PFLPAELKLRVRRLEKTVKLVQQKQLSLDQITIYPETGILQVGDQQRSIRRREMQILACLLRYKNQIVSRQVIIERVWTESEEPCYATLDVYIRRLRILL